MNTENSDHLKYMPRSAGEESSEEMSPSSVEVEIETDSIEIITESAAIESAAIGQPNDEHVKLPSEEEMNTPVALRFFYGVFSPLLVPTYVSLFIFLLSVLVIVVPGAAVPYSLTVLGATCIVPLITVYVLMKVGAIRDFRMLDRRERTIPYIIDFLALAGVTVFFALKGANPWIWTIYCGMAATALVNFFINFKLRISCHCSAMGAMLASLIVINSYGYPQTSLFWWLIGTVLALGLVGTAAITYGRHSVWEVVAGYATGFLGVILFSLIR